jgi:pseudouridine-5'-phosphate glycosidase
MLYRSAEVQEAIATGRPVVALESTIISHGMPYPQNLETALRVEQVVRNAGAVPATCAVIEGKLTAGISATEMELLAQGGQQIPKASRRDLPFLIAAGVHGATTVASTMIIAHAAGIRVFATGGIGGVHRGAEVTMDISADLQELAHTPVAVVCAGVKSILDIGLTLEYLETYGVPVIGFQTHEFPAFFSRDSGFGVDGRLDTPFDIAQLLKAKWGMDARGGVVVANPVPEQYHQPAARMERVIEQALNEAATAGIKGKAVTPFLLSRIEQLSGGDSLKTNVELVCHNALVAAQIASAYSQLG